MVDKSPPNVYHNFPSFLTLVASWIKEHKLWKSKRRACDLIREAGQAVFAGVGVYTVSELFFIAGMFFIIIWVI
jgi:hypothetical protein